MSRLALPPLRRGTYALPAHDPVGQACMARARALARDEPDQIHLDHYLEVYPYGTFPRLVAGGARGRLSLTVGELRELGPTGLDGALTPRHWWLGLVQYEAGRAMVPPYVPGQGSQALPGPDATIDGLPALEFITPGWLVLVDEGQATVWADDPNALWARLWGLDLDDATHLGGRLQGGLIPGSGWTSHDRQSYLEAVEVIREQIRLGEVYEVNLCRAVGARLTAPAARSLAEGWGPGHPLPDGQALWAASPMPFLYYLRLAGGLAMAGASPERYLQGTPDGVRISQPIKGTLTRDPDPAADALAIEHALADAKLIAENLMITDLVRNDLSRISLPGRVDVPELMRWYSFRDLHQLITTVRGQAAPGQEGLGAALWASFPMGSMTGAPKPAVMTLIDRLEGVWRRGPFSGALGYVTPEGAFDFAVVIRTLFASINFPQEKTNPEGSLWYATGGAIVWDSVAEDEWAEVAMKAARLAPWLEEIPHKTVA